MPLEPECTSCVVKPPEGGAAELDVDAPRFRRPLIEDDVGTYPPRFDELPLRVRPPEGDSGPDAPPDTPTLELAPAWLDDADPIVNDKTLFEGGHVQRAPHTHNTQPAQWKISTSWSLFQRDNPKTRFLGGE